MKFILAFNAEPLQLKFMNWVLKRDDITKETMMQAIKDKDKSITDAIAEFSSFQAEVKKYGNKVGNSSNIFMDCIYDRCANDDDSFKYMFGEDTDKARYTKNYRVILDGLYDAFHYCEEFSKEGKFSTRAKAIFDGFKKKNETLEKLVKDMNQILVENNKNKGEEDDGRTFEEQEEESWKTLEDNEVFHRDEWHVYQVNEYEDMRNVAADCSKWCVARRDSGRGHFEHYGAPYYLFSKGKRNPWILMHIGSEQFKGLDDDKFEADRPTSFEAIEIGREFLEEEGKFKSYYSEREDFSVFNEDNEFTEEPDLDNYNNISKMTQDELKSFFEKQVKGNQEGIKSYLEHISDNVTDYNLMLEVLSEAKKADRYIYDDVCYSLMKRNLPEFIGSEKALQLYTSILDSQKSNIQDAMSFEPYLHDVLMSCGDKNIIYKLLNTYCNDDEEKVKNVLLSINSNFYPLSDGFAEYLCEHDMKKVIYEAIPHIVDSTYKFLKMVINKYHDDSSLMKTIIDSVHDSAMIIEIASQTDNKEVIRTIIENLENRRTNVPKIVKMLLGKSALDNELERLIFRKCYGHDEEELSSMLMDHAKNIDEEVKALQNGASLDTIKKYYETHKETLFKEAKWSLTYFASHLADDEKIVREIIEACDYDLTFMSDLRNSLSTINKDKIPLDCVEKGLSKKSTITEAEATFVLKQISHEDEHEIADNPRNNRISLEVLKKFNTIATANTLLSWSKSAEVLKELILNHPVDLERVIRELKWNSMLSNDEEILRSIANRAIAENADASLCKMIIECDKCPSDVVDKIMSSHKGQDLNKDEESQLIELSKGMILDEETFIKEYCKKHPTFDNNLRGLLTNLIYSKDEFNLATRIILEHESIDEEDKFMVVRVIMNSQHGFKFQLDLNTIVDFCLTHEVIFATLCPLQFKGLSEQQVNAMFDIIKSDGKYMAQMESIMTKLEKSTFDIVNIRLHSGEEDDDADWSFMAKNPESTSEDLEKALESVEDGNSSEDSNSVIYDILNHKNCTQEIADRAIDFISEDLNEFIQYQDADVLMKWQDADFILNYMSEYTFDDLEKLATHGKSNNDIKTVIESLDDAYNYDYEEEDNEAKVRVVDEAVNNRYCSLELFEEINSEYSRLFESYDYLMYRYLSKHDDLLSQAELSHIFADWEKDLKKSSRSVYVLERCPNITEEQLLECITKYHCVDNDAILSNNATTERVLLEAMEYANGDSTLTKYIISNKAGEAIYEKAYLMCLGNFSLKEAMNRTKNPELASKIKEKLDEDNDEKYSFIYRINNETDDEKLKITLRLIMKQGDWEKHFIPKIENQKALAMVSKIRHPDVIAGLIMNSHVPEKTVLSLLKKNLSKVTLSAAAGREEKNVLLYVGCMTHDNNDIYKIFHRTNIIKQFTSEDIIKMIMWNPSCKFDILKYAYFKLSNEQILSLKKLEDKDVNWLIDGILKNRQGSQDDNVKASRIVDKLLKADRIARRITSL